MDTRDTLVGVLRDIATVRTTVNASLADASAAVQALIDGLDAPPVTPPPTTKRLLTAADFRYVRTFKMPPEVYDWKTGQLEDAQGNLQTRWSYATARIAGRYVDGQLRLALTMSNADQWREPVAEVTDPGVDGAQATLVANWGDLYQDRRQCYQPYSVRTGGLAWIRLPDGRDCLVSTYYDSYDVAAKWNPSIVASVINADGTVAAFGPWRTTVRSHQSCGFLVALPPEAQAIFGGSVLAVGAPQTAGDALSPWGGSLFALPSLNLLAPPDPVGPPAQNDSLAKSIAVQVGLLQELKHPLFQRPEYVNCRWNVPYDNAQGGVLSEPQAGVDDAGGRQQTFDGCVWIDDGEKHGVIYFGQKPMPHPDNVDDPEKWPHCWYGPPTCPHGRVDTSANSKGNHSDQLMPVWSIYDPGDLARVVAGELQPWQPVPVVANMINVYRPAGLKGQTGIPAGYSSYHGGAWYDTATRLLYVACAHEDTTRPVVRVFELL